MHAWLLTTWLFVATPADGSLLFLDNSNCFVELYTGSITTHVAVVMHEGGSPWVYEATPGEVRKLPLAEYYAELGRQNIDRVGQRKIRCQLVQPQAEYQPEQIRAMRSTLEKQVGRRYSIKGYVRGSSDGIHCAELAAQALCAAAVVDIPRCQDESPASLLTKIAPHSRPAAVIVLTEPTRPPPLHERTQERWWAFTDWCQWSCWETWTWCW